jgi:hypothetical protein
MSYNVIEGATIRFYTSKAFTSLAGTAANPDTVKFSYEVQGQTSVVYTWTNPTGDPSGTIVNTGTGLFQADINTLGYPGTWTWLWDGQPLSGVDTTKTSALDTGEVVVSPKPISAG